LSSLNLVYSSTLKSLNCDNFYLWDWFQFIELDKELKLPKISEDPLAPSLSGGDLLSLRTQSETNRSLCCVKPPLQRRLILFSTCWAPRIFRLIGFAIEKLPNRRGSNAEALKPRPHLLLAQISSGSTTPKFAFLSPFRALTH
jgi:hypothetical protein